MPGSPVSIADYLAIEIACRHTTIQRSIIADYFDITVNALNARLRTCSDRLQQFPDFVAYGITLLEIILRSRPDFNGKVHPIWEISKRLLQSYTNSTLKEELEGFKDNRGGLFEYLTTTDFTVNGMMPQERPNDDLLHLPTTRKRKHGVESKPPSRPVSPQAALVADFPEIKEVNNERSSLPKKQKVLADPQADKSETMSKAEDQQAVEKVTGKGSRSEPYNQHELCSIYIARKIRMLDWDTISWALSRFKTPTVAILSDARAAFDQYHDLIVDTLRLCCWPQDSMYLIACAAGECIAALERGSWADELKSFRNNRGVLYQIYMQRRLERIYKKSFETPTEKKHRRRRERLFGYEGLSIEDYGNLPAKKKRGAEQSQTKDLNKVRKRRTKEEMRLLAEEKAAAKALLKANGLKANGEAMADRRKTTSEKPKRESLPPQMPPTFGDTEASANLDKPPEKLKKGPRRKYDIPEVERIAFAGGTLKDRRMSYDVKPDDHILSRQFKHKNSGLDSNGHSSKEPGSLKDDGSDATRLPPRQATTKQNPAQSAEPKNTDQLLENAIHEPTGVKADTMFGQAKKQQKHHKPRSKPKGVTRTFGGEDESRYEAHAQDGLHGSDMLCKNTAVAHKDTKSSAQAMSISSLLDAAQFRSSNARITESFESAAASPFTHHAQVRDRPETETGRKSQEQKPRSSMSLAALLN